MWLRHAGPLTNVAAACELDPGFPSNVASLMVMGGAEAGGNVTATGREG